MANPITVDLPHSLGAQEARRRIERNIGKLTDHIPGGAQVDASWTGDRLDLKIGAMGQNVSARIDVMEKIVRLEVALPPVLSFFSGQMEALIRRQGTAMLEDRSQKKGG
jgi:putative polyhydroxyalkanoate system protein